MKNSVCHTWCGSVNRPGSRGGSGEALPVLGTSGSWRNSPLPRDAHPLGNLGQVWVM